MIVCSILAGGIGNRMGAELPKQYLKIAEKPIIIRTIEAFLSVEQIDVILILCPKEWVEYTDNLIREYIPLNAAIKVLEGGESRNETLLKAIEYVTSSCDLTDETILITHDAARPFVTKRVIEENINSCVKYGACSTYVRAVDTIAVSDDGECVTSVTKRSQMYQTQTPQTFKAKLLSERLRSLSKEELVEYTDAVGIMMSGGCEVHIVEGESTNIKITYPVDLVIAEAIVNAKKKE